MTLNSLNAFTVTVALQSVLWKYRIELKLFYAFVHVCLFGPCGHLSGKGLASWILFVVSHCKFVTFPLVPLLILYNLQQTTISNFEAWLTILMKSRTLLYLPANFVCRGYTVFTLSVRPSVTLCLLNNSKSHCWIFIKPCKHVHICKTNTLDKKVRARGQFY